MLSYTMSVQYVWIICYVNQVLKSKFILQEILIKEQRGYYKSKKLK